MRRRVSDVAEASCGPSTPSERWLEKGENDPTEVIDVQTQEAVTSTTTATPPPGGHRRSSWLWAVLAVGALLVVGIGVWALSAGGGDDQPTLTFDGAVATYQGPDTIEAGQVTFRLENESDREVVFVWGRHNQEGITEEQQRAWVEENPSSPPPWIEDAGDIGPPVPAGTTVEQTIELAPGPTDLFAWDEIEYVGYPGGTTIRVTDGS